MEGCCFLMTICSLAGKCQAYAGNASISCAYCQEGYTADMPFNFVFSTDAGMISTREKLWHGGDMHINRQAGHATIAVLESKNEYDYLNNLEGCVSRWRAFAMRIVFPSQGMLPIGRRNIRVDEHWMS